MHGLHGQIIAAARRMFIRQGYHYLVDSQELALLPVVIDQMLVIYLDGITK